MSEVRRRPGVDEDIFAEAAYLAERSESAALRFVPAVEAAMLQIADMPLMGSLKDFEHPALAEVRTWHIEGFRNHLIYYIPLEDGIEVLAIMHGARQAERQLRERVAREPAPERPASEDET